MERIGIYGGTFNPPHAGHIQAAKQAVTALKLDMDGVTGHFERPL